MAEFLFWSFLALIVYTYFGYMLLLKLILLVKGPEGTKKEEITPRVSLLISVYNEERIIKRKIENSLSLDYPQDKLEVMVISDASNDKTHDIVKGYASRGVKLLIQTERTGKTAALNRAVPEASGEIIVMSDANGIYERDALRKLVRNFADPRVGCVCGELRYVNPGRASTGWSESLYWAYDQSLKKKESDLGCLLGANGSIFAMRKALWSPIDERCPNDLALPVLVALSGYRVSYEPEAVSREEASREASEEFARKARIVARGMFLCLNLLGSILRGKRKLLLLELFSRKFLRYVSPFLLVGFFLAALSLHSRWPYNLAFALQLAFYHLGVLGYVVSRFGLELRVLHLPYYFCAVSCAALKGTLQCFFGSTPRSWDVARRGG